MNPLPPNPDFQAYQDDEHLRLLSIFHYILGGLTAFFGLFPILHIVMGLAIIGGAFPTNSPATTTTIVRPNTPFPASPSFPTTTPPNQAPPAFIGWMFVALGTFFVLTAQVIGWLTIYAGRCLARREKKTLIQVVAALNCLSVPFGTLLGVFTFLVLGRPTVAPLFPSS